MARPFVLLPALGALASLIFEPSAALAQETEPQPHASLLLDAGTLGERCISKPELEQAVQAQLGRVVFVEAGAASGLLVRVVLEESAPGHFRARVTSEAVPPTGASAASTRELEASGDCRALDEQLALVVALLVDAEPVPPPAPPEPPAEPEPPPPPEPPAAPIQDTGPVSSAPSWESSPAGPWHLALGASAVGALGLLPGAAGGAALELSVTPPAWPAFRLRALGFAPDRARAAPGAWLDVTLLLGGLGVCPELGAAGPLRVAACFGAEATLLRVEGHGLELGRRRTTRAGAQASGALLASLLLGRHFRVTMEAGTSFPFGTARFTADVNGEREELYRTPFAPGLLALGFSHEFY